MFARFPDEPLEVDDFIVVHVGYAIQKISPQEAKTAWELYDEMLAAEPYLCMSLPSASR